DSAQGFGCTLDGKHPLHWADVTTTSFFPAKPLGCYGDGGAVLSKDARFHDLLVSLRVHGQAVASDLEGRTFDHDPKYLNMRVGMNSRMDTIQAAVLLQKLAIFADEIEARNRVAARYAEGLGDVVVRRDDDHGRPADLELLDLVVQPRGEPGAAFVPAAKPDGHHDHQFVPGGQVGVGGRAHAAIDVAAPVDGHRRIDPRHAAA